MMRIAVEVSIFREGKTIVSDKEYTTTRCTTTVVPRVFSPRRSRGPDKAWSPPPVNSVSSAPGVLRAAYKFTNHDVPPQIGMIPVDGIPTPVSRRGRFVVLTLSEGLRGRE